MKLSITFFLLFLFTTANAVTRYVTPSGAGLQNGTNWANAFPGTSLQAAINASAPGDEVWVAAGTYFTTTIASRSIYFSMVNGVAIYGSFTGTETLLSQRTFTCGFSSILSAEIGAPGNADNSYHVISNGSLNNTAILDGFTITGGNANFDAPGNDSRSHGGGMLNLASNGGLCSPTVRNCLFTNNTAVFGAGMFNNGFNTGNANPVVTNCIFLQNLATLGGGGIDNFGYAGSASPAITNSIFYANTSLSRAGAMYCWGGGNGNASPVLLNTAFISNVAVDGGGIVCDRTDFGGATNSGTATPQVRNSIFRGNTASGTGPQFYTLGGAGFNATYTLIDITNQNPPHTISGAGTGNIFSAPSFVNTADADGADNCWLTNDDGLQLQLVSAGVDDGDNSALPATDIRGFARILNGTVDIGPYELVNSPLPVTYIDFTGRQAGSMNLLTWVTASESGNTLFEVQRSHDGVSFTTIGTVAGAGTTQHQRRYEFTDRYNSSQAVCYRLKQTDADGRTGFSRIILLKKTGAAETISVFPNPVVNMATVFIPYLPPGVATLHLYDREGRLVKQIVAQGQAIQLNMEGMSPGLYLLSDQQAGKTVKIIKAAGH